MKTSELTLMSVIDTANDLLLAVDVSDTTMATSGTSKKLKPETLLAGVTAAIAGKANTSHTHLVAHLSDATAAARALLQSYSNSDFASAAHSHILSDVDELIDALAAKQATLVSGTNIKTINSTSLLGSGNITISTSPAGSGTELQYRNGSAFAALTGSSVSGANLTIGGVVRSTGSLVIDAGAGNPTIDYTLIRDSGTGLLDISSPQGGIYSGIKVSAISFNSILSNVNVTDFYVRFGGNDSARYLLQRSTSTGILTLEGNQVGFTGLDFYEGSSLFVRLRPGLTSLYNSYTDASNYERFSATWSGNICTLGVQAAGTGTLRNFDLALRPSSSLTPANNGDLAIQATSNTSLTFKYKGSDGTVRSGSLTLS